MLLPACRYAATCFNTHSCSLLHNSLTFRQQTAMFTFGPANAVWLLSQSLKCWPETNRMQNFIGLHNHTLQPVLQTSSTCLKARMLASACASPLVTISPAHPGCVAPAGPSQGATQPAPPQPRQTQQQQYHTPQPPQPAPAPTVSLTSQGSGQVRGQPRSNQGGQGPSVPQQAPETSTAPQSAQTTATQAAQGTHVFHFHVPLRKCHVSFTCFMQCLVTQRSEDADDFLTTFQQLSDDFPTLPCSMYVHQSLRGRAHFHSNAVANLWQSRP